jgi:hypothetical protein
LVKQATIELAEIQVCRFTGYVLGEGIEQQWGNGDEEPPAGKRVSMPKAPAGSPGAAQVPLE